MDKDIDVQFLCKDCARYNLCEYYHRRKKDSYICKYFHYETVTEFADRRRECGAKYGKSKEHRWIPVSKKMPEENKSVMASTELGVFPEARYSKKYGWEWAREAGDNYWCRIEYEVTAWMPLPEPYKAESEDKE